MLGSFESVGVSKLLICFHNSYLHYLTEELGVQCIESRIIVVSIVNSIMGARIDSRFVN